MDVQSAVSLNRAIQVDQAIFTSIRTPMGEGYRIVACSPAIKEQEKKELARRLPSHGSLCESSPSATALLSFPMASGRHCVALSQYAGHEHTARGGSRVFTRLILLQRSHFATFDRDPFAIRDAASRAGAIHVDLKPSHELEPLELVAGRTADTCDNNLPGAEEVLMGASEAILDEANCARLKYVLETTMCGEQLMVSRAADASSMLRRLLQAIPIAMRADLSASAGLNYSPHRELQLALLSGGAAAKHRLADKDFVSYDWHDVPPPVDSRFGIWVSFVGRHWESGRHDRLNEIAGLLTHENTPEQLALVVSLYEDMERALEPNAVRSEERLNTRSGAQQQSGVRTTLLNQLRALLRIES